MLFYFRENFGKIFAKIRNENNTKYRGISFREIFVATLLSAALVPPSMSANTDRMLPPMIVGNRNVLALPYIRP